MKWWERRRRQKSCFHHEKGGNPSNSTPAVSWIKEQIIDCGRAKMFWCDPLVGGCGKVWIP